MAKTLDQPGYLRLIREKRLNQSLLAIALPMLLAHITAPMMGLVDTAVLGHMPGSQYLAGASFAALLLSQIYWICGFLRMSATGLSAQARGQNSTLESTKIFYQSLFSALVLGVIILLLGPLILQFSVQITAPNSAVADVIDTYFSVRIWGAPAALMNLALIGWMLGQQMARAVMWIQIIGNLVNIGLNLLFVYVFDWQVAGVAGATVTVEYLMLFASLYIIFKTSLSPLQTRWMGLASLAVMSKINSAILVRNLALQVCLVFITFQGLALGEQTAAVNAIIMQFFVLISLGLDAVAFAIEAKVGEAKGAKNSLLLHANVLVGIAWSNLIALVYALIFLLFGSNIIGLLTDQEQIQEATASFLSIVIMLPLVGHWCFALDGIFIGLTRAKAMQNGMLISAFCVFFPLWWWMAENGNWALWFAFLGFLASRGITLGAHYGYLAYRQRLVD